MSERLTPDSLLSMSSPAGFRARTSQVLASVLACLTALAPGSGSSTPESFAFFDHESSSWKTSQGSFLPDSESSWPIWPKRGMTHAGRAYEAPTSPPHTVESASSWLLPTPKTGAHRTSRGAMVDQRQWAAPVLEQAIEMARGILPREFRSWDEVPGRSQLLPPPRTTDSHGAGTHGEGGPDLRTAMTLLPTPTSQAAKHGTLTPSENTPDRPQDQSNLWVVVQTSLGEPTNPPSDDGSSSPGPLPGQLTIGDV